MINGDYLAAIDAGTGGVRCVLFDARGNAVGQDYRETLTLYAPDGRAEQDPIQLVRNAWDAARGALIRGGVDPSRVAGITVTGTQTTFVPVDGDGNFLTNLILWQDARGTEMFPWIRERLERRGMTEEALYRRTLRPLDGLLAGAKLLWLKEREPELYGRIRRVVNPQSVLLKALGAEEYTLDETDGGWWLSQDTVSLEPDGELVELFGLNPGHLPRRRAPGDRVGSLSRDAAARTGLREGTPLFQGAVDQCCAVLGAGNPGSADIGTLCMGTAGVLMTYSDEPKPDPLCRYYVIHFPGGGYASEIAVPVAASAFRWVRDMLFPPGRFGRGDLYARMDAEAAKAPAGSGGLAFLPFLAGSLYPRVDGNLRGGWIGASLGTSRAALVRSALEGICFEMRQLMEVSGSRFGAVRVIGGAARSGLWNQMQADVYGCPVETVATQEATALGAAMIAAWGAGLYPGLDEAVAGMARLKRRYEPDPDRAGAYGESYAAWLKCVESLSAGAFDALGAARRRGRSEERCV